MPAERPVLDSCKRQYNPEMQEGCSAITKKDRLRVDGNGRAYAGSQRQLQTYVNEQPDQLSAAMLEALHLQLQPATVEWVSPLASQRYAEYKDADFLHALGLGSLKTELAQFWPNSGPRWDALARFTVGSTPHYVLVEAKSHVPEMYSNGCCAKSPRSLGKIVNALDQTKSWLGVRPDANWMGPLYQAANRLAHLYWFRQVIGLEALIVNVHFVDDPHSPTSLEEWKVGLAHAKAELGISDVKIPGLVEVFLPARD